MSAGGSASGGRSASGGASAPGGIGGSASASGGASAPGGIGGNASASGGASAPGGIGGSASASGGASAPGGIGGNASASGGASAPGGSGGVPGSGGSLGSGGSVGTGGSTTVEDGAGCPASGEYFVDKTPWIGTAPAHACTFYCGPDKIATTDCSVTTPADACGEPPDPSCRCSGNLVNCTKCTKCTLPACYDPHAGTAPPACAAGVAAGAACTVAPATGQLCQLPPDGSKDPDGKLIVHACVCCSGSQWSCSIWNVTVNTWANVGQNEK